MTLSKERRCAGLGSRRWKMRVDICWLRCGIDTRKKSTAGWLERIRIHWCGERVKDKLTSIATKRRVKSRDGCKGQVLDLGLDLHKDKSHLLGHHPLTLAGHRPNPQHTLVTGSLHTLYISPWLQLLPKLPNFSIPKPRRRVQSVSMACTLVLPPPRNHRRPQILRLHPQNRHQSRSRRLLRFRYQKDLTRTILWFHRPSMAGSTM